MNAAETTEKDIGVESTGTASELDAPRWAVISFDRIEAKGQTYDQAEAKLKELEAAGITGLCVVTDEAAERTAR